MPLLPSALLEVLNTPTPFVMGVHSSLKLLIPEQVTKTTAAAYVYVSTSRNGVSTRIKLLFVFSWMWLL